MPSSSIVLVPSGSDPNRNLKSKILKPQRDLENWSALIADLAPERYSWTEITTESGDGDKSCAKRELVVKSVAERGCITHPEAQRVVSHAAHLRLVAETPDGSVVYVPNAAQSRGDSYE